LPLLSHSKKQTYAFILAQYTHYVRVFVKNSTIRAKETQYFQKSYETLPTGT
jgi:hypothetical protein